MISCLVVRVWKSVIHLTAALMRAINWRCAFSRMSLAGFLRVSASSDYSEFQKTDRLTLLDQLTIMVESSRSFLFTEYARGGCGTFHHQGTDPKVWDVLPVSHSLLYSLDCDDLTKRQFFGCRTNSPHIPESKTFWRRSRRTKQPGESGRRSTIMTKDSLSSSSQFRAR